MSEEKNNTKLWKTLKNFGNQCNFDIIDYSPADEKLQSAAFRNRRIRMKDNDDEEDAYGDDDIHGIVKAYTRDFIVNIEGRNVLSEKRKDLSEYSDQHYSYNFKLISPKYDQIFGIKNLIELIDMYH